MNCTTPSSHCPTLTELLPQIIQNPTLHAYWLNSLSLMESVGARKIAAYIDPHKADLITLQHAAEEARHAYFLKRQILKLHVDCPDYSVPYLLAPRASFRYLHKIDSMVSRRLSQDGHQSRSLKHGAYLLVTYLIEIRAMQLYHTYQAALTHAGSRVHVQSIIKEEEGHLENMMSQLDDFLPNWHEQIGTYTAIEQTLYDRWLSQVKVDVTSSCNDKLSH